MEKHSILQQKTQKSYSTIGLNQEMENINIQQGDIHEKFKQNQNNSMKKLCPQFFRQYRYKCNCNISINSLSQQFNVSKRRIYDLVGMLEGFQFINKTKQKGTYVWMGNSKNRQQQNNQVVLSGITLKDVAYSLKQILSTNKKGLSFKQLTIQILKKISVADRQNVNESTLIRRIYQCLKVMKDFQLITKEKKIFQWKNKEEIDRLEEERTHKKGTRQLQEKEVKKLMRNMKNKKLLQNRLIVVSDK